jgi:ribosomal protein S4E
VRGGKNVGRIGRIVSVEGRTVELETDGERFQAPLEYVIPTGDRPLEVRA